MTSLVLLQILKLNPVSFYDFAIYLIIWIKVPFLYFRRILKVAAKRKATEDISQRPWKVIRSVLCDIQEDHLLIGFNTRKILVISFTLLTLSHFGRRFTFGRNSNTFGRKKVYIWAKKKYTFGWRNLSCS
jgi:hypothetical protein